MSRDTLSVMVAAILFQVLRGGGGGNALPAPPPKYDTD